MEEIIALLENMEMGAQLYALICQKLAVQERTISDLQLEIRALHDDVKKANARYSELLYRLAERNRNC